ncbi:hypothetical protein SDC9_93498 [bioreactor metagenome]|uniref:Uncharacterized protein n=1 Tax=bioreactor metagenome TaxID=1076179 RepID=A0A645A172_9ZZZZ
MNDARRRRYDAQIFKRLLAPTQKLVAFAVALIFAFHVAAHGVWHASGIHLQGVIDDQIHRDDGVDAAGVAAQFGHGRAHGRQIYNNRNTGEILHHHPAGVKGNRRSIWISGVPVGHGQHIFWGDVFTIIFT